MRATRPSGFAETADTAAAAPGLGSGFGAAAVAALAGLGSGFGAALATELARARLVPIGLGAGVGAVAPAPLKAAGIATERCPGFGGGAGTSAASAGAGTWGRFRAAGFFGGGAGAASAPAARPGVGGRALGFGASAGAAVGLGRGFGGARGNGFLGGFGGGGGGASSAVPDAAADDGFGAGVGRAGAVGTPGAALASTLLGLAGASGKLRPAFWSVGSLGSERIGFTRLLRRITAGDRLERLPRWYAALPPEFAAAAAAAAVRPVPPRTQPLHMRWGFELTPGRSSRWLEHGAHTSPPHWRQ